MSKMVVFRGEICWLESIHEGFDLTREDPYGQSSILFELVPVEGAVINNRYRRALVGTGAFKFLPSSIDFSDSEWSVGVSNGQAK